MLRGKMLVGMTTFLVMPGMCEQGVSSNLSTQSLKGSCHEQLVLLMMMLTIVQGEDEAGVATRH
jgi:hypothetical protein